MKKIRLSLEIPKIPEVETVAYHALERLANYWGISEEKLSDARIILTEAIINALEHSGAEDPVATIKFELTDTELVITVRDFGKGFNIEDVDNPDIDKKMFTSHKRGWGLKLMQSMSDDFTIDSSSEGTIITMRKKI